MKRILVINTGSSSTKLALFEDETLIFKKELQVPEEVLRKSVTAMDQLEFRVEVVLECLEEEAVNLSTIDMLAARGGMLPPIEGGAFVVNDFMVDVVTYAPATLHESSLACVIARRLADPYGIPAIIYDGVTLDEMDPIAKMTGVPGITNPSSGHPLNARRVAREAAKKIGIPYEKGNFIVAHFGSSISVSAHKKGRIIDSLNPYTGAMSPQRAGRLPTDEVIKLCYSGKYTQKEVMKLLNGKSGFVAYCGTQNARTVFELAKEGNLAAQQVIAAVELQVAKCIANMHISINEKVDRIVFTGGMARAKNFTDRLKKRVSFSAPVEIFPGEFEMEALAEGALRVLNGDLIAKDYYLVPPGYRTKEDFYQAVKEMR